MKKRKILYFEPHGNLYGSERSFLNLIRILKNNKDTSIFVISNKDGKEFNKILSSLKVTVFPVFKSNLHLNSRISRVIILLRIYLICLFLRPNIIHLNQIGGLPYMLYLKRFLYRNVKLVVHNRHQDDILVFTKYINHLHLIDHLISVSKNEHVKILKIFGVDNTSVLYNPFELKFSKAQGAIKNKFICISRINEVKNQLLILEALSLDLKNARHRVDFFGDSDSLEAVNYLKMLNHFIDENKLHDVVEFFGFDYSVNENLKNYKCLILPSVQEAMGRVIIEALINGIVPIVLNADTGAKEIILNMDLSELLFENNSWALLQKMNDINNMSQIDYNKIVSKAQLWISKNLNDKEYLKKLELIYA